MPDHPAPDEELIRLAQTGDTDAFGRLVERYFGTVYAIAWARLGRREMAEDLTQEVFLRAYLHLDQLPQIQSFPGWLVRVTHNLCTDWQRRGNRESRLLQMVSAEKETAGIADEPPPTPRQEAARSEENKALREAIFRLPVEQREVILLRFMEDLPQDAIADRLGIHRATVHRRLKRGQNALKQSLEPILREAARTLKAPARKRLQTIALVASLVSLSAESKAAIATAAGGVKWFKTTQAAATWTILTGGPAMVTGKILAVVAVVAAAAVGGDAYLEREEPMTASVNAREAQAATSDSSADLLSLSPQEMLRRCIANRLKGPYVTVYTLIRTRDDTQMEGQGEYWRFARGEEAFLEGTLKSTAVLTGLQTGGRFEGGVKEETSLHVLVRPTYAVAYSETDHSLYGPTSQATLYRGSNLRDGMLLLPEMAPFLEGRFAAYQPRDAEEVDVLSRLANSDRLIRVSSPDSPDWIGIEGELEGFGRIRVWLDIFVGMTKDRTPARKIVLRKIEGRLPGMAGLAETEVMIDGYYIWFDDAGPTPDDRPVAREASMTQKEVLNGQTVTTQIRFERTRGIQFNPDFSQFDAFNLDEIPEDMELLSIGEKDLYYWHNDQLVKKE
ncbi:RNA polymerase sigma factor [bacterium]|nr:RNA polymerase sigma factor [bacterium]